MDTLDITALRLKTYIGVHAWEQRILQEIRLDIQISIDLSDVNDDLSRTLDYSKLCELVRQFVESNSFSLIETLACDVASLIKKHVAPNQRLILCVSKPHAIPYAGNISITVRR